MALVVTLALLVLLTFTVVAFLTKARSARQIEASSGALLDASEIALSAGQVLLSDLQKEISANSDAAAGGFRPRTDADLLPQRQFGNMINLIRQSTDSEAFFAGGSPAIPLATGVSTATPSKNGRTVPAARWFGAGSSTTEVSTTPVNPALLPPGLVPSVPQWINVTTSGLATSGNLDKTVGRFAFNIYDTSGLLDINNMGSSTVNATAPTTAMQAALPPQLTKFKGHPAYAEIHGVVTTGSNTAPHTGNTSRWKYNSSNSQVLTNPQHWHEYIANWARTGGTRPAGITVSGNASLSKHFVGRQDLLNASVSVVPAGTSPAAATGIGNGPALLPTITHFLREKNAPVLPYLDQATLGFVPPDATYTAAHTIQLYTDDGKTTLDNGTPSDTTDDQPYMVEVKSGDPVLQRRFSLGKLGRISAMSASGNATYSYWLTPTGPGTGISSSAIKAVFGLVWDATNERWVYTSPDSTSPVGEIKSLNQISAAGRAPDFFEILKAGINPDSLGGYLDSSESSTMGNSDLHVLRIGASVIDQADTDSIPTLIQLGGVDVAGVEDLPYLAGVYFSTSNSTLHITPVFSNPHRSSSTAASGNFSASGDVNGTEFSGTIAFTSDGVKWKSGPAFQDGSTSSASASLPANSISVAGVASPFIITNFKCQLSTSDSIYDALAVSLQTAGNFTVSNGDFLFKRDPRTMRYHPQSGPLSFVLTPANTPDRPQSSPPVNRAMDNAFGADITSATATSPARPMILQRPFRNVAEMGHVFRDQPWKSLNFSHEASADLALLDLFSVSDIPTPSVAGRVNLNAAGEPALKALFRGAGKTLSSDATSFATSATSAQGDSLATSAVASLGTNPSYALPGALQSLLPAAKSTIDSQLGSIKHEREAVARALTGMSQTRTWNVLIDVIAQSGKYPTNASSPAQFLVEGESRYWIHAAIDRYTGEIVDIQWEGVNE